MASNNNSVLIDGDIEKSVTAELSSQTMEDESVSDQLYSNLYSWLGNAIQQERNHWKKKIESTLHEMNRQHKSMLTHQTALQHLLNKFNQRQKEEFVENPEELLDGTFEEKEPVSTENLLAELGSRIDAILDSRQTNLDGSIPELILENSSSRPLAKQDDHPGVKSNMGKMSKIESKSNHTGPGCPTIKDSEEIHGQGNLPSSKAEDDLNKQCSKDGTMVFKSTDISDEQNQESCPKNAAETQNNDDKIPEKETKHDSKAEGAMQDGGIASLNKSGNSAGEGLSSKEEDAKQTLSLENPMDPLGEHNGNQSAAKSEQETERHAGCGAVSKINSPNPVPVGRVVPMSNCQIWSSVKKESHTKSTTNSPFHRSPVQQQKEQFSVKKLTTLTQDERQKYVKAIQSKKTEIKYLRSDLQEAMDQIEKLQKVIQRLYVLNRHMKDTPRVSKDGQKSLTDPSETEMDSPKNDTARTVKNASKDDRVTSKADTSKDNKTIQQTKSSQASTIGLPGLHNRPVFQAMPGAEMALWKLRVKKKNMHVQGKRTEVTQCLRCQRLFRPSENNNIACRYHRNGQETTEKYDNKGKLVRVVYKWACCQRSVEEPGCTHSQHI